MITLYKLYKNIIKYNKKVNVLTVIKKVLLLEKKDHLNFLYLQKEMKMILVWLKIVIKM